METAATSARLPQIIALWQQVLASDSIEPDTHFFLAGGDSLQLARLLLRVREHAGLELRLQDMSHFGTPRKMAQWCGALVAGANKPEPAVKQATAEAEFVANSSQQGLWWSEQQSGVAGLYNSAVVMELHGPLQWRRLADAINLLVKQFPVLASCLQFDTRQRRLVVRPAPNSPRLYAPDAVAPLDLPALAAVWAAKPFDLHCNAFRCRLLRHSDIHHSLLLGAHHCVLDGWSGGVLLQQLATNYCELIRDPHWQAPAADTAFALHCQRQQQRLKGDGHRQQLDWWRQYLSAPAKHPPALPWQPTAEHWPYRMQQLSCRLPAALMAQLQTLCVSSHCTPFAVLATALAIALRGVGAAGNPVIGLPSAARTTVQEEQSIGCYMQLLPLYLDTDSARPLSAQLDQVHEAVQAVLANALPLPELVRALRPTPMADGNAWFDVVLALQNFPATVGDWSPLTASCHALLPTHGQHLLKLEVTGDTITAQYAEAIVPANDVRQLLQLMQQALQNLVA